MKYIPFNEELWPIKDHYADSAELRPNKVKVNLLSLLQNIGTPLFLQVEIYTIVKSDIQSANSRKNSLSRRQS